MPKVTKQVFPLLSCFHELLYILQNPCSAVIVSDPLTLTILPLSQANYLICDRLCSVLVPFKVRNQICIISDHSSHVICSGYSINVYVRETRKPFSFSPVLTCHTHLLPVMVMPVDTHWKMPTPGMKLRVMTGSFTSFTFILGGDRHPQQ